MKAMTNRIFSLILSASMLASLLPVSALAAGFVDVPQSAYYQAAVDWAVANEITAGTSGTEFSPDETCTRAQAVTFLWRVNGQPNTTGNNPFADVAAGSYYADAVQWAVANGITSGTSATTFEPDAPVTRAQVVTFLYRNAGSPSASGSTSFADVPTNAYYADAVRWAVSQGITAGTSANAFSPDEICTRAQIVTFLYRASDDAPDVPVIEIPEEPVLPEEPVQPEQELTDEEIQQMLGEPDIEGATAAIINGLRSMEKRINLGAYNISTTDAIDLTAEISDFRGDNPYYIFSIWATLDDDNTILVVGYQYTPEELAEKLEKEAEEQAVVDAAIASCVTNGMSDYEIAKALHDYLATHNEYDMRLYSGNLPALSRTSYGALVNRTSVCSGYALAYQHLMEDAGIPCEYVTGMTTRGSHAWNIVQIGGEWYHVDVTWDDPIPNREGYVRYDYFLKSDSAISRDHVSWEASRACTSTKYDNTTILSPEDEQEAIEQAEEEAKKEAIISELLALCYDQVDRLPYRTQEELQSAENISYDDTTNYIYIPADQYDYETACEAERRLVIEWMTTHPEFGISDFSREPVDGYWRIKIIRQDVYDEIDRRNAQAQADLEAQAAEVELLLQQAIQNAQMQHYEYQVTGYTDEEIKLACSDMNQSGYTFDGYTSADYRLRVQSGGRVIIVNRKWAEQEIERQAEIIRSAIRSGQTEVRLDGQQADSEISEYYYPSLAADRVGKDGYFFDGLTAGEDYTLETHINKEQYVVRITYLNDAASASQPAAETQPTV